MNKIDFHSHILPGADHGSDGLETSIFQLNEAIATGIDTIVATPHFYPHRHSVEQFLEKRNSAVQILTDYMKAHSLPINLRIGAEVLLCQGMERLPGLEKLLIEGTNTLLLELPFSDFHRSYYDTVEAIIGKGYTVLLAHCDRYDNEIIENMLKLGAKMQLNVSSIGKLFVKRHLKDWISDGVVYAFGSDIHGKDKNAYKLFNSALGKYRRFSDAIMQRATTLLSEK